MVSRPRSQRGQGPRGGHCYRGAARCAPRRSSRRNRFVAASRSCALIEHRAWHWTLLIVVFGVVCLAGIASGAVAVPVSEVIRAIGGRGDDSVIAIVRNLRLPRVALAALVGAGL